MAPEQRTRKLILGGFAIAILAMIVVGIFAARSASLFAQSAEQARSSQRILATLEEVMRLVTKAESDARGYVITGSKQYLQDHKDPTAQIESELQALRGLNNDSDFQKKVDAIDAAAKKRVSHAEKLTATFDRQGSDAASNLVRTGEGLRLMQDLEKKVGTLRADEQKHLERLSATTDTRKLQSQIFLPAGIVLAIIAVVVATRLMLRDADLRTKAEQELFQRGLELKRAAAFQKAVLDSTNLAIVAVDDTNKINLMNRAAESMLGYAGFEVVGKASPELFHDKNDLDTRAKELGIKPSIEVFTKPAQEHGVFEDDTIYVRKDGSRFPVNLTVTPLKSKDGDNFGFVGIAADLSERAEARSKLEKYVKELEKTQATLADKNRLLEETARELERSRDEAVDATNTKSEFLANMSHEIRTPLNGVLGTTHLLLNTELNDKQRSYVQLIHRSAESLLSILNDILDLSKMEAGKMTLEEAPFDLRETAEDVCEQFAPVAHQKGIELNLLVPPQAPIHLVGDSTRIRQVLTNLVANAIKFTEKGEVDVKLEVLEENAASVSYRLSVRDTGIGIPVDKLDAIFESFTQADGATARRFGGTGLGLAISRQLVELMHGEIGVGSRLGEGSEFWFEVKLLKQEEAPAEMRNLNGASILVADDNETNRFVLRTLLESWNCRVREAVDGAQAKQLLMEGGYDCAILDMRMPGQDGMSLAEDVRSSRRTQDLALILVSSSNLLPTDAEAAGLFQAVLSKPVRSNQLYESVAKTLRNGPGPKPVETVKASKDSLQGVRVLVVEDNPINQLVVTEMLKSWGCTVAAVDNGRKAVEKTAIELFDMALMDVQMPEMDGLEATMTIRKRENGTTRHLPIIAMTANAMRGDEEKCLNAGMDAYMAKPIQPKLLVEKMAAAVGRNVKLEDLIKPAEEEHLPVFDVTQLEQTTSGKGSLQVQVLDRYLQNLEPQIGKLKRAVEDHNIEQVKAISHSLKGSSWTVGAVAIADLFRRLESGANSMSDEALARTVDQADSAMAAVRERIEGHMQKLAGSNT